jgi:hypothetical protein
MMRREGGRVFVTLTNVEADRLCRLPREFLGNGAEVNLAAGTITFDFTEDGFSSLLLALGQATGAAPREEFNEWIRLANAVNEGNPHWTPYEIPGENVPVP